MIQTILQSKGLEYEDVLLFDFFSHTEDQERISLRVLASIVKNGGTPALDKTKHAVYTPLLYVISILSSKTNL